MLELQRRHELLKVKNRWNFCVKNFLLFAMTCGWKNSHCGSKNWIFDMRIFLLVRFWAPLLTSGKKIPPGFKILGEKLKYLNFWFFFNEKWAKSSSESHIAPESPSIFFPEFGSPKSVQLGTSVNFWGTWWNFSHFWPYLAKCKKCHFSIKNRSIYLLTKLSEDVNF